MMASGSIDEVADREDSHRGKFDREAGATYRDRQKEGEKGRDRQEDRYN